MKAVLSWVSDPYVHMIVVALILVRLAMGAGGGEEQVDKSSGEQVRCRLCDDGHEPGISCPRYATRTTDLARSR
jgi:hypothetical protein